MDKSCHLANDCLHKRYSRDNRALPLLLAPSVDNYLNKSVTWNIKIQNSKVGIKLTMRSVMWSLSIALIKLTYQLAHNCLIQTLGGGQTALFYCACQISAIHICIYLPELRVLCEWTCGFIVCLKVGFAVKASYACILMKSDQSRSRHMLIRLNNTLIVLHVRNMKLFGLIPMPFRGCNMKSALAGKYK